MCGVSRTQPQTEIYSINKYSGVASISQLRKRHRERRERRIEKKIRREFVL